MLRTLATHQPPAEDEEAVPLVDHTLRPPFMKDEQPSSPSSSEEDKTSCGQLFDKLIRSQQEIGVKLAAISESVGENQFASGMGYYDAKNLLFIEYLIQLQFYQLFRVNAIDLTQGQGQELYKRLVYLKTVLNKLGPVEKKLQYHKNKLLRSAEMVSVRAEKQKEEVKTSQVDEQNEEEDGDQVDHSEEEQEVQEEEQGESGEEEALNYRPGLRALMDVKKRKDKEQSQEGKYVPVKGSAALSKYDQRARNAERQDKRMKAHILRQYMKDIREDDEAREDGMRDEMTEKYKKKFQEKTDYEEEFFTRIPDTKKERFWKKSMMRKAQRTEEMKQGLKDIEMIGKIFREQKREMAQERTPKEGRQGRKKVKRG